MDYSSTGHPYGAADAEAARLKKQIAAAEEQLRGLKLQLHTVEKDLVRAYQGGVPAGWSQTTTLSPKQDISNNATQIRQHTGAGLTPALSPSFSPAPKRIPAPLAQTGSYGRLSLEAGEYSRYGRQLTMPEIGLHGQLRLKQSKVLIVGLGGLGCPAAAYLAGAGVGTLGLMDGDTVEVSNLHRQIAHSTDRVGMLKADSAAEYLQALNPNVNCQRYQEHLTPEYAISVFSQYELILDCTDNPASRYLTSDACILTGKPLVSASALKTEGQLIVLNNPPRPPVDTTGGPCYRCVFPKPPPADSVLTCGEGGILGPVVGVMGVLQALEAIKVLTAKPKPSPMMADSMNLTMDGATAAETPRATMTMFSAYSSPQFRSVRMRARRPDCAVCSPQASITLQSLTSGISDYVAFCGVTDAIDVLPTEAQVSATDFSCLRRDGSNILIDVRDETQYAICALSGSVNVPWTGSAGAWLKSALQSGALANDGKNRYIVCRLGNDSQLAVRAAIQKLGESAKVKDIKGGFRAWREEVDPGWPDY